MWNGKNKAITFSFDDGVKQDKRLISLLNKYNVKATFNLNSSCFGSKNIYLFEGKKEINRDRFEANEIKDLYKDHEVAAHTCTHHNLTELSDKEIVDEVERDRQQLSDLVGYKVVGLAYPCGGVNNNDHVAEIIKNQTQVKYCRTITSTHNFDLQNNLYRFNPTVYFREYDVAFELAYKFIELKTEKPQCFYIWCHAYEFDYTDDAWDNFEEFLKLISNKDDIFYGTNSEVLLGK